MGIYRNILVAVDLRDDSEQVILKAKSLAAANTAQLYLLHVIEPVGYAYGGDIPMDLSEVQQQLTQHAKERLANIGHKLGIGEQNLLIEIGKPSAEIHRLAKDKNIDLVIVGSHGRHGLQLLLGSTANAVLHGSGCDVLAVRIGL